MRWLLFEQTETSISVAMLIYCANAGRAVSSRSDLLDPGTGHAIRRGDSDFQEAHVQRLGSSRALNLIRSRSGEGWDQGPIATAAQMCVFLARNGAAQMHSKTFRGNRVRDHFSGHCLLADYHRSRSPAPPQTLASLQDYALATIIKSARNWMSERSNLSDIRLALSFYRCNAVTLRVQIQQNRKASGKVTAASNKSPVKRHYSKLLFAALALIPAALLAQNLAPTPRYSDQAELSKVEEWVLSQGIAESIAPELAAILGLGSDRLPVKLKAFRTSDGINLAFAVSTNPKQKGIVISALKTMADKMEIYSVGTAWLTDRSGTLRQTIAVDASGAKVLPNNSRAAKFKDIKDFFIKKLQATSPTTASSPSPRISATAARGKEETK